MTALAAGWWLVGAATSGLASGNAPPPATTWVVAVPDGDRLRALVERLRDQGVAPRVLPKLRAIEIDGRHRARLLSAARADGAITYAEPSVDRRLLAEPADAVDPGTGRPFAWAQSAVGARAAIAAAGGGAPSSPVAVVDTGIDADHPDLLGRVADGRSIVGGDPRTDLVGHGTFVAGLVSAADGNGLGGFGVGGATPVIPIKVSDDEGVSSVDLAAGIVAAVDSGARVINVSIGGPRHSAIEEAALAYAQSRDVLVVAAAGNSGGGGSTLEYPAAALGGDAGGWSRGLSVAATTPAGTPATFSTRNRFVSIAAPGAGGGPCAHGVHSTLPSPSSLLWSGGSCSTIFTDQGAGRYGYGEGTSFASPLVAGAAALVRQVRPALRADQVADVLVRSASGTGWNQATGAGILDMPAAIALAGSYDTSAPILDLSVTEGVASAGVTASADDPVVGGNETAGGVTIELEFSRDGADFAPLGAGGSRLDGVYGVSADDPLWFRARACDRNRNCTERSGGPYTGTRVASAAQRRTPLRGSILSLGLRRCDGGARTCLRVGWKLAPSAGGRAGYTVFVTRAGSGRPLARVNGRASGGRRIVTNIRLRRNAGCGRLVVRIRLVRAGETHAARRPLATRRCGARLA